MDILDTSKPIKDINKYCKIVGWIFIGLGILHFILSGFLSAWWGGLLIILGIVALSYRSKSILILVGLALILVGLLNIYDYIIYETTNFFWLILGIVQIIWGTQELRRYKGTKENPKYVIKKEKKKDFVWYLLIILLILMIIGYIIEMIFSSEWVAFAEFSLVWFLFLIFIGLVIPITALIFSIIYLKKHKKKVLALITLFVSLVLILSFLYGFVYGLSDNLSGFTETQIADMETYCGDYCYDAGSLDYMYYLVDYDYVKESPVCYCLDENEEVLFEKDIPLSAYE